MPGLDLSTVSSNWKRLQAQLGCEKSSKDSESKNPLKRKQSEQKDHAPNVRKKFKADKLEHEQIQKQKKRMGAWFSKSDTESNTENTTADHTRLLKEHDIAPKDIAAAYGTGIAKARRTSFRDDINGGLHPTHKAGKYVALDCEMVGTGAPPHEDNVLARASLVNYNGDQIYDSYVQAPPGILVEDYRTFVSGIRQIHMREDYARTYSEVQADVAQLLDGRILVGHALKNDLEVLKLGHARRDLRDTSRHPKFRVESKGRPPALRKLAKSELGLDIQIGEHSSVEDARAAMLLFRKEQQGFEEENRKHFGTSSWRNGRVESRKSMATSKKQPVRNDIVEDDDAGDLDEGDYSDVQLDEVDEDDEVDDRKPRTIATSKSKKKSKKKKRTKRK